MSLEFSGLLRADLRQLLGFEVNSEGRGFQGAHVLGRSAVASKLGLLFNYMNNGTLDSLGADHVSNGVLLPGSNRSNTGVASAIMGTAAHSGANVAAFDELFFDAGAREGQSNKFINKLLDSIELAPSDPAYKTPQQMRIEFKNFLDFVKIQFMYQDVLNRLPDDLKGPTGLHSLGFNSADPRWQNAAEVNAYLRGLDANLFDYNTISNHPLYQKIDRMRVGDADIPLQTFVDEIPESARIFFPDGEFAANDFVRADVLAREQIAHAFLDNKTGKFTEDSYTNYKSYLASDEYAAIRATFEEGVRKIPEAERIGVTNLVEYQRYLMKADPLFAAGNINDLFQKIKGASIDVFKFATAEIRTGLAAAGEILSKFEFTKNADGYSVKIPSLSDIDLKIVTIAAGGAAAAGFGLLKIHTAWMKYDGDTPEFQEWLKGEAVGIAIGLPIAGAAMYLAAGNPAGMLVLMGVGGVMLWFEAKDIFKDIIANKVKYPEGSYLVWFAETVLPLMETIEGPIEQALDWVGSEIAGIAEAIMPRMQFAEGDAVAIVTEPDVWLVGFENATLLGSKDDDILLHTGLGQVFGFEGDDILVGLFPDYVKAGTKYGEGFDFEGKKVDLIAEKDLQLELDGGAGNDWVITVGGEKAVTVGGNGRDWIFNTSAGGIIYGDTVDGVSPDGSDLNASANSDKFWFAPNVTIMDARSNDRLAYFGWPLVGGNNNVPFLTAGGSIGFAMGGGASGLAAAFNPVFFDYWVPGVVYFMADADGQPTNPYAGAGTAVDLIVADVLTNMLRGITSGDVTQGLGYMKVKNFSAPVVDWGIDVARVAPGDLGMVFKRANLALAVMELLPPIGAGGSTLLKRGGPLLDEALALAGAGRIIAKHLQWASGADPLVIDLDDDGIETTFLSDSRVYFDTDGDLFAERTAWLSGDDARVAANDNNIICTLMIVEAA